jgi:integrase
VFPGVRGGPLRHGNFYARHFKPAVRRLVDSGTWPKNLRELRFHDLRHTCASMLIEANVHAKGISELLGHSSIAITMDRYGHLYKDREDEPTVAGLEKAYAKAAASVTSLVPAAVSTVR